ncbi:MAG TPA: RHS repeat-associated core domain-containing protein, partial [Anaerolineales bacterium]|nr:RHS repeat-associated core domain-containing protein [Anaerolineales bacterium]
SVTVSGQTTQFIYNGDGNLVKKIKPDGSKTLYVGGIYEVDKASGGSVTRTVTYYPVAGAMRINSTLYYILKDHLGSASVVTDASGNILGEQRYYPFGETRLTTGTIYTDKLFTGQREMAGLGIYHYQARFYSPKLGRFLSADTIVPNYANPQAYNRYSYVLNNPLRYIDPSGHDSVCGSNYSDPECNGPDPWVPTTPPAPPPYVPLDPGLPQGGSGGGGGGNNNNNGNGGNGGGGGNAGGSCNGVPDCGLTDETAPVLGPYVPLEPGLPMNPTVPAHATEETCGHCAAGLLIGFMSFMEGAVVAGAATYYMLLSFSLAGPIAIIGAPGFLLVIAIGVNWMAVGYQEMYAGLHPDKHYEIDYLPLVPDAWHNR